MIVLISWQSGEFYKKIINIRLPYLNTDDTFFLPFKFLYIKRIQNLDNFFKTYLSDHFFICVSPFLQYRCVNLFFSFFWLI
jgi:hypothetical protein